MRHGSLFSGIGAPELAAEWMGWETLFHCEKEEFPQQVLKYYWPDAETFLDIKNSNFKKYANKIDVLSGGFPCQPYSTAGKRLGTADDRHLWPEMLRAIREIQPRWVVGENVRGIISWNGGLVFHEVQTDLEAEGYKVLPFLLPACAVNAPHRRDRVWFVAFNANSRAITGNRTEQKVFKSNESTNSIGIRKKITANTCSEYSALPVQQRRQNKTENFNFNRENESRNVTYSEFEGLQRGKIDRKQSQYFQHERLSEAPIIADANKFNGNIPGFRAGEISQQQAPGIQQNNASDTTIFGQQRGRNSGKLREQREVRNERLKNVGGFSKEDWQDFPTQSPVCSGNDGISTDLLRQRIREDSMGCLSEKEIDKIFSKADTEFRTGSLMAYGNSMVPQEVFQIFKAIEQYEKL